MTTRAISGGQMVTSGSKLFLTGAEEVAQNVATRLKWFYGEAFLEPNGGTPHFQTILGKSQGQESEAAIKRVILNTNGVRKLTEFEMTVENYTMQVNCSLLTIYSAETVSVSAQV